MCVCNFFNLYKDIFKLENKLCCLFEFFLFLYNEEEWEGFLVYCGMKSEMIFDIFLEFVNWLEFFVKVYGFF